MRKKPHGNNHLYNVHGNNARASTAPPGGSSSSAFATANLHTVYTLITQRINHPTLLPAREVLIRKDHYEKIEPCFRHLVTIIARYEVDTAWQE